MSTQRQRDLLLTPLATPDDLHRWIRLFCNLNVPRVPVVDGHGAPFDYLARAYFEPAQDQVVHAPRGGGKTRLAAVATLLDLLHKPGVSVRILGGSLEQSLRLWEHLMPDLTHAARDLIDKRLTKAQRITLANGSTCAVLPQSERSVRGLRVQKLRCDEVELFKPDVWEAAQLVTRSKWIVDSEKWIAKTKPASAGYPISTIHYPLPPTVHGSIDALSTLHEPFGLMQSVLDRAEKNGTPIVRWSILDVLARCEPERACDGCALFDECGGVAKVRANGFVPIDDAIASPESARAGLRLPARGWSPATTRPTARPRPSARPRSRSARSTRPTSPTSTRRSMPHCWRRPATASRSARTPTRTVGSAA